MEPSGAIARQGQQQFCCGTARDKTTSKQRPLEMNVGGNPSFTHQHEGQYEEQRAEDLERGLARWFV